MFGLCGEVGAQVFRLNEFVFFKMDLRGPALLLKDS